MRFGISTFLFHGERLHERHVDAVRSHGFDLVEIFATRTHFDYRDEGAVERLRGWLRAAGVEAASVHAPICASFTNGVWGRQYSTASADNAIRQDTIDETIATISAAQRLGSRVVVVHLGVPIEHVQSPRDNDVASLRKALDPIAQAARAAGIRLALEVIPNDLATPDALLDLLASDLELGDAGVCLDTGHAHMLGGAPEAAEALGGYLITTHLHDNRGTNDDHLLPFAGTIDWVVTLAALVKTGYMGPWIFELPDHGRAETTLQRAVGARRRLQGILESLAEPLEFSED